MMTTDHRPRTAEKMMVTAVCGQPSAVKKMNRYKFSFNRGDFFMLNQTQPHLRTLKQALPYPYGRDVHLGDALSRGSQPATPVASVAPAEEVGRDGSR
jgi:hypothetical protein